jgi:hypothetical protein
MCATLWKGEKFQILALRIYKYYDYDYVDGLGRGNMDYWVEDSYINNSVECVDM